MFLTHPFLSKTLSRLSLLHCVPKQKLVFQPLDGLCGSEQLQLSGHNTIPRASVCGECGVFCRRFVCQWHLPLRGLPIPYYCCITHTTSHTHVHAYTLHHITRTHARIHTTSHTHTRVHTTSHHTHIHAYAPHHTHTYTHTHHITHTYIHAEKTKFSFFLCLCFLIASPPHLFIQLGHSGPACQFGWAAGSWSVCSGCAASNVSRSVQVEWLALLCCALLCSALLCSALLCSAVL